MYETQKKARHEAAPARTASGRERETPAGDPYGGSPLHLSGELSARVRESFGIRPQDLKLRESAEVADMGAKATAQGDSIRFAPGHFRPDTPEGLQVLGHELEHVREQARGNVPAEGGSVYVDQGHEARSDAAGAAFAEGKLQSAAPVSVAPAAAAPVQGSGLGKKFRRWQENRAHKKRLKKAYKARDARLGVVRDANKKAVFGEEAEALREAPLGKRGEYSKNLFDQLGF